MQFHPFTIFGANVRAGVLQEDVTKGASFPVQTVDQVHGAKIYEVLEIGEEAKGYDAMVTSKKNLVLMVQTADCIPLVLADEKAEVVAAVHAGWRSLTKDIIPKTIKKMVEMGAVPKRIKVGIGPSLGICCSTFSDPHEEIPKKYHFTIDGKMVDLNGICDWQLENAGILAENVECMDICTKDDEEWFSWRRDKDERRFGTLIEITEGTYFIQYEISEEIELSL